MMLFISDVNAVHARPWAGEMLMYIQNVDVVLCPK